MFCPSCGTQCPGGARFCDHCGAALPTLAATAQPAAPARPPTPGRPPATAAPATPPSSGATPSPSVAQAAAQQPAVLVQPGGYELGGLLARVAATVLDGILLAGAIAAALAWAAGRWGQVSEEKGFFLTGLPAFIFFAGTLLGTVLFYVVFEGLFGATPGKFITRLQVRRKSGERAGFGPVFIRTLMRVVDGMLGYLVGFLVAAFSRLRQRAGDHLAGTVVAHRNWHSALRAVMVLVWVVAVGASGWKTYTGFRNLKAKPASATSAPAEVGPVSRSTAGSSGAALGAPGAAPLVLTSGDLKVTFSWLQGKDGPLRPAAPYKPGDDVVAKYEVTGFTTDPQGRIDVGLSVVPLDPNGLELDLPWTDTLRQTITANTPINASYKFHLAPFVPAGTYRLVIKVRDAVKNTEAEFAPAFVVQAGAPPTPAYGLQVRNFRFAAADNGPPLEPAVFADGQTVHYRFEVAGMGFQADRSNVHIAYRLLGPKGEVLLDKPDWMSLDDEFRYHPPTFFVPVSGYVTLPSGADKGTYTQRFELVDKISKATVKHEAKFQVR